MVFLGTKHCLGVNSIEFVMSESYSKKARLVVPPSAGDRMDLDMALSVRRLAPSPTPALDGETEVTE